MKYVIIILIFCLSFFLLYNLILSMRKPTLKEILLGYIDLSLQNKKSYYFKCPSTYAINFSIEIVDNSGGMQTGRIESDLKFKMTIKEKRNDKILFEKIFSKENLKYGSWHGENTAIIIIGHQKIFEQMLKEGNDYSVTIEILTPDNLYTGYEAKFYLNYVDF